MSTRAAATATEPRSGAAGQRRVGQAPWWVVAFVAYVAATVLLAHGSGYQQGLLLVAAVFAILASSLDLVAGVTGLYSLGHAGLFAIGAYGSTVLATKYGWNVFEALPVAAAAVGVIGLVIGALSLRVSGLYFAITTLVFTIIVNVLVSNLSITGGYQGLPSPTFPSFPSSLSGLGTALVWAVSGCLLLSLVLIWSIRASALFPVLLAIRESEPFATSVGVRTDRTRVLVFGLSAALAGIAGWTFSFLGFITPGQFNATASINILVMVILGGMNTRLGPICGAAFISLFPTAVTMNPLWQEILFGAVFIFVIVVVPEGFVGLVARGVRHFWRPRDTDVAPVGPARFTAAPRWSPEELAALPADVPALEARGIGFSYVGGVPVLDGVDLVVRRGTIHGLIGPNGSGKSTLVNLLSGRIQPAAGTIKIHGERVDGGRASGRAHLGLMRTFQTPVLVPELDARHNVTIGLYSRFAGIGRRAAVWPFLPSAHRDDKAMAAAATVTLGEVGLKGAWGRTRVADMPHGVEQLTQLAAACAGQPSILVLDEPLAGLSSGEVDEVAAILRELRDEGVTTIVVEHQTRFIFEVCDEVTVLAAGELVAAGSAGEVRVDERVREVYLGQ